MNNKKRSSSLELADLEFMKGKYHKARGLFEQALTEDPKSYHAKIGLGISLLKMRLYRESEILLDELDISTTTIMDELTIFRFVYTKSVLFQKNKKILDGLSFIDQWISRVSQNYQPLILLEKAAFLIDDKNNQEALNIIIHTDKILKGDIRNPGLERMVFLASEIKEMPLAFHYLWERFRNSPSIKIFIIICTSILFYRQFNTAVAIISLQIVSYLIPINKLMSTLIIIIFIPFGLIPIIAYYKLNRRTSFMFLFIWTSFAILYLSKLFPIVYQVILLITLIINLLMQIQNLRSTQIERKNLKGSP